MPDVFSVPVFFVVLRESIEAAVIISMLFAYLEQTLDAKSSATAQKANKTLFKQVWLGAGVGFFLCLVIGAGIIGAFYSAGQNVWQTTGPIFEGIFYLLASLIISVMGAALLRISKMQEKWRRKIEKALDSNAKEGGKTYFFSREFITKYAFFVIAFITVFREGIEGIIFIAGVSFSAPASSVPLPVIVGLLAGFAIGYILYKGAATAQIKLFLVFSTCLLYLVAAGLFARAITYFEVAHWNSLVGGDAAETGVGPGSYDIDRAVWHLNCCSPEFEGGRGWGIFNGILGWDNTATYSSVIGYILYWLVVIAAFLAMRYREVKGRLPFMGSNRKLSPVSSHSGADKEYPTTMTTSHETKLG